MDKLRKGFTTGSCAAAAAKAACLMLLTGNIKETISIGTPKGPVFDAKIEDIIGTPDSVKCAVRKDGGDDPDVTTGALIYAEVAFAEETGVRILGGEGVGRVTRPGLDQPVGEAAINSVPRAMITEAIAEVCRLYDHEGGITVTISVPGGEKIAEHTFNPRLGIEGGISIIGTSGVVEPMSEQAILDTIRVELSQKKAEGHTVAFISPGNYGLDFMKETYGTDLDRSVKCSNYIGDTIDMIRELGFDGMLLTGHAGKLVKVSGGIMNTHSRMADCRMELISAAAAREGASNDLILHILDCLTTEEAFALLEEEGILKNVSGRIMQGIMYHLNRRAQGELHIECIMYNKENGILAASDGAEDMINKHREQWNG
ncbi:MAG: cobalamin biosynthesis protein CbiD [Mogibacterium sp.]|nr:cobalamin biosynthesis protein CbiD [Mogibacterium sp.]